MVIMVTGALGFVGINLVARLAAGGHQVVGVGRRDPDAEILRFLGPTKKAVTFSRCDIRDGNALSEILSERKVERIIHCAVITATHPDQERLHAAETVGINVAGTTTIMESAANRGVRDFVYISSGAIYGPGHTGNLRLTERTPPKPEGLYGITKLAGEVICARLAKIHGVRLIALRLTQPYGPMERRSGGRSLVSAICDWVLAAVKGEEVVIQDGNLYRDYTYISDITDGIIRALFSDRAGIYNLSLAIPYTLREVLHEIRQNFPGFRFHLKGGESRLDINRQSLRPPLDSATARRDFAFHPTVTLADGIAMYAEWVKSFGVV